MPREGDEVEEHSCAASRSRPGAQAFAPIPPPPISETHQPMEILAAISSPAADADVISSTTYCVAVRGEHWQLWSVRCYMVHSDESNASVSFSPQGILSIPAPRGRPGP